MTAILRNSAASPSVSGARLGGGGSGRAVAGAGTGKVERRLRRPEDPAAELMPAAAFLGHETDFAAILEQFRDSPFDPARRRVLGRLMGVFAMDYQGANAEERRFLRRLLAAGNPREGYVANRALHLCVAPHVIRRTLALGVAESRFNGAGPGFLGAVQARIAATMLRLLGPRGREAVWNLLTQAGQDRTGQPIAGADRVIERALILKALGARRHLLGPWSSAGQAALDEVAELAAGIRGCGRETLAARTCLEPGDPQRIAPRLASLIKEEERAVYIARGDLDPMFAWKEHGARREEVGVKGRPEPQSSDEALPDMDRSPLSDRPRLHWALAEARAACEPRAASLGLSSRMREALTDYLAGREMYAQKTGAKDAALRVLAERGFDVAREEAIEAIRCDAQGIYRFDAARAFGDLLSRYSGATYVRRLFSDQTTAGADPLGQITAALAHGLAVPITVNELKLPVCRAFAAVGSSRDADGKPQLELSELAGEQPLSVAASALLAPVLPEPFGRRARADAYLAPAALDLLAPPFGIAFPELGIEDRL